MGLVPLGTLPVEPGSKYNEHHFLVNDGERGGQYRVWYTESNGVAYCAGDNSTSCRHAVKVAEHFGIGNQSE
jgi:hypothetical protein